MMAEPCLGRNPSLTDPIAMTSDNAEKPTHRQRREMIAIAAYYLAEQRDFAAGGADSDWLLAEGMIDAMIVDNQLSRTMAPEKERRLIRNALVLQGR